MGKSKFKNGEKTEGNGERERELKSEFENGDRKGPVNPAAPSLPSPTGDAALPPSLLPLKRIIMKICSNLQSYNSLTSLHT